MKNSRYLLDGRDPRSADEQLVGGKAASLARMLGAGFRVPPFCVVTCEAFTELSAGAETELLREPLIAWIEEHGMGRAFAVRSSARGEDSSDSSFAGLYTTVLDVNTVDDVLKAIATCWASHENVEAQQYRERRGAESAAMGVVVQLMIPAEWAGVAFSANPVTSNLDEGVVNAVPGLGEALVSGATNPEEIIIDARTGAIRSRQRPDGREALPDSIVGEVWAATQQAATAMAFPQDIEWASVGTDVFVLQSRPITTIADVYYSRYLEPWVGDSAASPDDRSRTWSRAYADEIWAPPVSALFYNVQNLTPSFASYWKWHHDSGPLPPDVFKYHQATAYVDVEVLRRQYAYHPRFSRIAGIVNFFPQSMQETIRSDRWLWRGRLRRTLHFELQERKLRSLAHNHRTLASMWPGFVEQTDGWFELDLDAMSLDEIARHRAQINEVVGVVSPACGFAVAYHAHDLTFVVTGLLERWFGDGDRLYALVTSGLEGSVTVNEAEGLWQLADLLRSAGPEALGEAERGDVAALTARAQEDPTVATFTTAFDSFWRSHRHRGASYKDLIYPRWGDAPDQLLELVASYVGSTTQNPRALNAEMAARRKDTQRELLARCRGRTAWRRPVLRWLFKYNEIYMSERDNHRFYFDRVWYQLRRIHLSYGGRLAAQGILPAADDIFHLGSAEIEQALAGELSAEEAHSRVQARRAVWERTLRVQSPKFLVGYTAFDDGAQTGPGEALTGIGASPGVVTGRARIVHEVRELPAVRDGEILVTRQTDPAWSTVFSRIGGLVLETGGVLAHGASLCREFSLPCVTALDRATERIADGGEITVDGTTGRVTVAH